MKITSLKNCLSTFSRALCQKIDPRWRKFESQTKVEHKLTNMQTAFDILSTLVLRDYSKWTSNKDERGEENNAHPNFRSKSNKRWEKNFNFIDRMTEQIESLINQVCKESDYWVYSNLQRPRSSFFQKSIYFCIVDV